MNADLEQPEVFCGVLEFSAPPGIVYAPHWMIRQLGVVPGARVSVQSMTPFGLQRATFIRFYPTQSSFFQDVADPRTLLEEELHNYTVLTTGDLIEIRHNTKTYDLRIVLTKPTRSVLLIDTNVNIEFATSEPGTDPVAAAASPADLAPPSTARSKLTYAKLYEFLAADLDGYSSEGDYDWSDSADDDDYAPTSPRTWSGRVARPNEIVGASAPFRGESHSLTRGTAHQQWKSRTLARTDHPALAVPGAAPSATPHSSAPLAAPESWSGDPGGRSKPGIGAASERILGDGTTWSHASPTGQRRRGQARTAPSSLAPRLPSQGPHDRPRQAIAGPALARATISPTLFSLFFFFWDHIPKLGIIGPASCPEGSTTMAHDPPLPSSSCFQRRGGWCP